MKPEDLRLVSDFRQPYDHHFASRYRSDLPEWRRSQVTTRTRREDHDMLAAVGLVVPERGTLDGSFRPEREVVAYLDPSAHRGEGKLRGAVRDLLRLDRVRPDTYASAWVGPPDGGRTLRFLAIGGGFFWWLDYRQRDPSEWRSNVGDVEVSTHDGPQDPRPFFNALLNLQKILREPLVAVDFVRDGRFDDEDAPLVAIDLATAPGIAGTPVAEHRQRDVAEAIAARWHELYQRRRAEDEA